ncbi:MAG: alpha-mannosidase, partial [Candidatus Aminicenantes bacterium]|nr:alpha-mannosidase [Candidatus Aminicenantes bacterium]
MKAKPAVHLICNAHLDPVWQWRWEEGAGEAVATFGTAAEILKDHPDLIFCHNEAVLYQWVERLDPALFREIKRLVKEGRWAISGGWYLQPDVNLPGIESTIRQISEGREYFREKFGVVPRVAYNFDSFGHGCGLPQVLKKAGYRMYIHMRPQEGDLALPSDLYRWRGVDGSEILTYRIAVGLYHTEYDNIEERIAAGVEKALELRRDVPVFWGIGNHGGGATREDLGRIDALAAREKRARIIHSTPDKLYAALRAAGKTAPIVEGDLQRVFTGCYTSLARLKRKAVSSLGNLVQTEALRAAAWWTGGQDYPDAELREAWKGHLFNDFHDILPGSSVEPAEADALGLYGKVDEEVRRLRLDAAAAFNAGPAADFYIPVTVL